MDLAEQETTIAPGASSFPPTLWSVVLRVGERSEQSAEALETLCRVYWHPIYSYLRRQGKTSHEAEDFTQSFFQHLLERNTLEKARRDRGKFRSFLLTTLQHFLTDQHRKAHAQKRGGGTVMMSIDAETAEQD